MWLLTCTLYSSLFRCEVLLHDGELSSYETMPYCFRSWFELHAITTRNDLLTRSQTSVLALYSNSNVQSDCCYQLSQYKCLCQNLPFYSAGWVPTISACLYPPAACTTGGLLILRLFSLDFNKSFRIRRFFFFTDNKAISLFALDWSQQCYIILI